MEGTGLASLLRRKVRSAAVFYSNNNGGLGPNPESLAYLFGDGSHATDTLNVLEGPVLAQLFDETLWPEVLANLTGPERRAAREAALGARRGCARPGSARGSRTSPSARARSTASRPTRSNTSTSCRCC